MAEWYYLKGREQFGPVRSRDLRQIADNGQVLPTDLVWREGLPRWVNASQLKGLFHTTTTKPEKFDPPPLPKDVSQNVSATDWPATLESDSSLADKPVLNKKHAIILIF